MFPANLTARDGAPRMPSAKLRPYLAAPLARVPALLLTNVFAVPIRRGTPAEISVRAKKPGRTGGGSRKTLRGRVAIGELKRTWRVSSTRVGVLAEPPDPDLTGCACVCTPPVPTNRSTDE